MPMVPQEAGSSPSAGPEHIPSPPERPSSVTHSYSSGTISAAVPMNDIPPNISSTSRAKQSPILQRLWGKLGLNRLVVMFMVKGALAPTIACAIYQKQSVAKHYLNFGYLMIIISILSVPMLPRGKFLMNLFLSLVLTCFAASMVLLGQWAAIQARKHTTPFGATAEIALGYNSSASVVNALFMMFNVFGINVLRAARPAFSIPTIGYTVYVLVGFVYGPQEPTEFSSIGFSKELLYSFLTGQAIAMGVSLFVIPVSSRNVFFAEAAGFLQSTQGSLKAQSAFVEALEYTGMCEPFRERKVLNDETEARQSHNHAEAAKGRVLYNERASTLKSATVKLLSLGGRLRDDVVFARREISYSYLRANDIHEMYQLLRNIMIPISGLSTTYDMTELLKRRHHLETTKAEESTTTESGLRDKCEKAWGDEQHEWEEVIRAVHCSFERVIQVLDEAIQHILLLLKLVPTSKVQGNIAATAKGSKMVDLGFGHDIEKGINPPKPGDLNFGSYLDQKLQGFKQEGSGRLKRWCEEKGLGLVFHDSAKHVNWSSYHTKDAYVNHHAAREIRASQRLRVILYMEYLLYSSSNAIFAMVRFAESKVEDGTMKKQRFIFPTLQTLIKWIKGLANGGDASPDIDQVDNMAGNVGTIYLGDSLRVAKDPEHLPPKNFMQVLGNRLRKVPKFLGSDPVKFGARVAIATMSVGILAYLRNTHAFFIRQRVVWCLVIISIGMSPSSGSAVFNLLGNLTCTLFAMVGAFINWYIVDQKTPGVIVFLFFFLMFYFYFAARYPRFLVAIAAGAITHVLIIGYELQVRVIGIEKSTAAGQPFYPIFELAPYRLLSVGGGCLVAYIWTIFPVPITERSILRRDLGGSLFLLANYVSSVTSTVDQRLRDKEGNMGVSSSPGHKLQKMRQKVLQKELAILNSMRQNLAFMAWEPSLGGDFPKETYRTIINEVQNVVNYLTVIAHASETFNVARQAPSSSTWLTEFARSKPEINHKAHKIASLVSLMSASIRNGQPLPPYLKTPSKFHLSEQIEGTGNILALSNLNEPGFRELAVMELAHKCLVDSVDTILGLVKDLVGEVDFSYHVVNNSAAMSSSGLGENVEGKQKSH